MTTENLRLLIGQDIGLQYLVPVALDTLEENPLAEGDMYKGDLLSCLARVDESFWLEHPELNNRVVELKFEIKEILKTVSEVITPLLEPYEYANSHKNRHSDS